MKQSYKVVFCIGAPHQALIHLVRIHTIGLVILGAKAKRNCAGSFVGSEADKIFQHCPVPVLSLREELEKQHRNKFERASLHAC
jgi:nucleotide-binding universal stress UspA family protein